MKHTSTFIKPGLSIELVVYSAIQDWIGIKYYWCSPPGGNKCVCVWIWNQWL